MFPNIGPFAAFRASMTYLRLAKYIFGISLLAQTFFQSMVFQMENWHQNWRFCILYLAKVHFWYWFVCSTSSSAQLWIYSVSNGKLASILSSLYFLPSFCPNFYHFCRFQSIYNLSMSCKVHSWHCFVFTTICSVHLWSYSAPNGNVASKFMILYFWPPFGLKFSLFFIITEV